MQWCRFASPLIALLMISSLATAQPTTSASPKNKTTSTKAIKAPIRSSHSSQNMWKVIASNFSLPHYVDTPAVQRQIKWFQANPKYFNKVASQGQPYIYYIYTEVKKRGLPGELVLLPMIESAYDPFAYSWVGAAGLWQMMPATGSNFGLKQNWWYDGRKDIISSTSAALDYLTYLETFFNGNWPLAIAAYNSGEGTVQNAIDRNAHRGRGTTFWALDLPTETESYVPRLLALAAIINNPGKYGINLPPIHYGPYFGIVSLKRQIDLSQAAKMANIPLNSLYELNPGYNRWATDPKGPYRLLLPLNTIPSFKAKYAVQFGSNSLVNVNSPSKTTTEAVLASNTENNVNANNIEQSIIKGQAPAPTVNSLKVDEKSNTTPAKSSATQPSTKNTATSVKSPAIAPAISVTAPPTPKKPTLPIVKPTIKYTVKSGDTLWSIAKHFNVTIGQLKTWNKLSEKTKVKVGQILLIEQSQQQQSGEKYTVKSGDSLYAISRTYGLSLAKIKALNPQLAGNSELKTGTVIYVN